MEYELGKPTRSDYIIIFVFLFIALNNGEIFTSLNSVFSSEYGIVKLTLLVSILVLFTWVYDKHETLLFNERFREKVFMYDLRCNLDYTNEHICHITHYLSMGELSVRMSYLDDRLINGLISSHKIVDLPEDVIHRIFAVGNKMASVNNLLDMYASNYDGEITNEPSASGLIESRKVRLYKAKLTNESVASILDALYQLREHLRNIFIDLGKEKEYIEKTKLKEEEWRKISSFLPNHAPDSLKL